MNELLGYVFSPLREGDIALYRGSGNGLAPILLVAAEETSLGCVERLEHEYALKAELDADWAARPVALTRYNGRTTLVLEDPGGAPLDRLLGRPLDVSHFLRIAIPLAGALRQVHERGLIHKDIKPANILVDAASGGVWLTGFGIASRLPREHQAPAPPEMIAGTLAYMAPEQTGRMNRSVDSRSDLYALGCHLLRNVDGAAALHRRRSDGVGTLPYRAAAGTAQRAGRGRSGAALGYCDEAPRQDRRGALPNRRGRRGRSAALPGGMGGDRPHRAISAGRARHVGPAADPGEALRPGARDRHSARGASTGSSRTAHRNSCSSPDIPASASPRS